MPSIPLTPSIPVTFTVAIPPQAGGGGTVTINVPDHTLQLGAIGLSLAGVASSLVTLATSMQLVTNVAGGIQIKDALDPYQYSIVTQALAANGIPIPPGAGADDIVVNALGGAINGVGALAGVAAAATAASGTTISLMVNALPVSSNPAQFNAVGAFPDPAPGYALISASLAVISTCISFMAENFNKSVDIKSKSLITKKVLSSFMTALNSQAITTAGRVPPVPPAF